MRLCLSLVAGLLAGSLVHAEKPWRNSDDPLFDYILTDQNAKALKEINARLEQNPPKAKRAALVQLKVSTLLKLNDPVGARAALDEAKKLGVEDSSELSHQTWLVYWELLRTIPKSSVHYENYRAQANAGLSALLANPAFFNGSTTDDAEEFLKQFPDSRLSTQLKNLFVGATDGDPDAHLGKRAANK